MSIDATELRRKFDDYLVSMRIAFDDAKNDVELVEWLEGDLRNLQKALDQFSEGVDFDGVE